MLPVPATAAAETWHPRGSCRWASGAAAHLVRGAADGPWRSVFTKPAVGFYKGTRKLVSLVTPPIISTPWLGEGGPGFCLRELRPLVRGRIKSYMHENRHTARRPLTPTSQLLGVGKGDAGAQRWVQRAACTDGIGSFRGARRSTRV